MFLDTLTKLTTSTVTAFGTMGAIAPTADALLEFRFTTSSPAGSGTGSFTLDTSVKNQEQSNCWGLYPNAVSAITIDGLPMQGSYFLRTAALGLVYGKGCGSYWEIFFPSKEYLLAFVFADDVDVDLISQLSQKPLTFSSAWVAGFSGILWEYKGLNWNINQLEVVRKFISKSVA